jgi:hypothetical protein
MFRDCHRHSVSPAEVGGYDPVRIGEVRVNQIEAEIATQPLD